MDRYAPGVENDLAIAQKLEDPLSSGQAEGDLLLYCEEHQVYAAAIEDRHL